MDDPPELGVVFMRWGVGYREIIYAAVCIMEDVPGNSRDFSGDSIQAQRRANSAWLDFACDLTRFFPDCPKQQEHIIAYARGGDEGWTVRQFKSRVPEDVWRVGAPIAAVL